MEECERMYVEFVVEKLQNAGGCLKFQHLTGHLSQLNEKARRMVGTKPSEIMRFLRGRKDLFIVEQNGMISLQSSVLNGNDHERSEESNDVFPMYLREEEGTVIKVFPNFGFIHCKKPKTKVYFPQASLAEGSQGQLLTDILDCGKKVLFNARKVDSKLEAKYQASRVWFPKKAENEVLHPEGFSKTRKTRDTGLYDPPKTEGIGRIQNVFENIGFIMIDNDPKNTVYFTKKDVRNVENVTDLTKVVKINDSVEFKAIRSMKKDAKSRWQATSVFVQGQPKAHLSQPSKFSRKMEKDVPGKIYPSTKGIIIKFGPSLEKVADADSCIFYLHGTKIEDVSWEFSDGDPVLLDVISIKSSPYWKALLCWVGQRPNVVLKEDLGDFSGPEVDMDDIPESGSFTSKTSGFSSEKSYNNEVPRNTRFSNSNTKNVPEKSSKQRYPRDTKKTNFHNAPSRSLSRSSRSSQHSQSSRKTFPRQTQDPRKFQGQNLQSQSYRQKYERDSGFGSSQKMNVLPPKRHFSTQPQYSDEDCSNENELVADKYDDLKEKKEPSKKYDSWGDTPYPGEEDTLSDDPSEVLEDTASTLSPSKFRKSSPVSDEKYESDNSNESDVRLDDSEDEASEDENPQADKVESMFENDEDDVEGSPQKAEEAVQPYIRLFRNMNGKLLKVYCKYAEIEHPRFERNVSFFWTDVYYKGEPVANISEDLKEVLKVGQSISFDCFDILDDKGGLWNKVIMVWVEGKPKIKEITPQEFIKENQLVVSATEVLTDEGETSCDTNKKFAVPRKKFLTVVDDDSEDSSDSAPEPSDAAANVISKRTAPEFPLARQELSTESCDIDVDSLDQPSYKIELKKAIEKLLSSHNSSKSNTETIVSDVVDFVLNKYVSEESSDVNSSKENECQAARLPKEDPTEDSAKCSVNVTDSAVQTIITGEVISLSVFTLRMANLK